MEYYFLDVRHVPFKVDFEEFKKFYDRIKCEVRVTNNIIAFLIPHNMDNDGVIETEYLCAAFIIIN